MKKKIVSNIFLSTALLGTLLILDNFLEHNFLYHYIATGLFFVTYTIQQLLIFNIGTTPSSFVIIYNVTTMLKMFMSLLFLAGYYLFLSEDISQNQKNKFIVFFILTYFCYLIVNTKNFFSAQNENT